MAGGNFESGDKSDSNVGKPQGDATAKFHEELLPNGKTKEQADSMDHRLSDKMFGKLTLVDSDGKAGDAKLTGAADALSKVDPEKPEDVKAFWKSLGMTDATKDQKTEKLNEIQADIGKQTEQANARITKGVTADVHTAGEVLKAAIESGSLASVGGIAPEMIKAISDMDASKLVANAQKTDATWTALDKANGNLEKIKQRLE